MEGAKHLVREEVQQQPRHRVPCDAAQQPARARQGAHVRRRHVPHHVAQHVERQRRQRPRANGQAKT